jgi:catechol-2,3-dioxygenase
MERRRIDLSKVDLEGLHDPEIEALKKVQPPADMPFKIGKMGHAVLVVRDIDASVKFYTQVLGFKVSDVYPDSMVKGRMVLCVSTKTITAWVWLARGEKSPGSVNCII